MISKNTLKIARDEIISLRRSNELLSARVEMIDLFACVLHTKPAEFQRAASPDVAWELSKAITRLEEQEAKDDLNRPDVVERRDDK